MGTARSRLYSLVARWSDESTPDSMAIYPYKELLEQVLFHGDTRFCDYTQGDNEEPFPARLLKWLKNVRTTQEKQTLLKLVRFLQYFDARQIRALYRDAFTRIISPWLSAPTSTPEFLLSPTYENAILQRLAKYTLLSITESFSFPDFCDANNRLPLSKPIILGEHLKRVRGILRTLDVSTDGAIVLEDFVGSGNQSRKVLAELKNTFPKWRILFVPLIILERGHSGLTRDPKLKTIEITPSLIIPSTSCISRHRKKDEPPEFRAARNTIFDTQKRVTEKYNELDDAPDDPFGYRSCGSLVVTRHNVPNNTLPLIHHRAPKWNPLFRRAHHLYPSMDGLR